MLTPLPRSLRGRFAAAFALIICVSSLTEAAPITHPSDLSGALTVIDFETCACEGLGSVVLSGVTFSGVILDEIDSNGFAASILFPEFVSGVTLGLPDATPGLPNFTMTFAAPVAQVGFGLFDPNFQGNVISAYDSAGNLLESTAPDALFPPGGSGADYLGFIRLTADISRIEIVAAPGDALWIDNLAFNRTPVPEPATLSMFGVGLVVAAARLLKRR